MNWEKKKHNDYDLVNFYFFIEENYKKDVERIGNGLLMWEKYIKLWKKTLK